MIIRLALTYQAQKGNGATLALVDDRPVLTTTKYNRDTGASEGTKDDVILSAHVTALKNKLQAQLTAVTLLETDINALS